jgi:hypothetical protein
MSNEGKPTSYLHGKRLLFEHIQVSHAHARGICLAVTHKESVLLVLRSTVGPVEGNRLAVRGLFWRAPFQITLGWNGDDFA